MVLGGVGELVIVDGKAERKRLREEDFTDVWLTSAPPEVDEPGLLTAQGSGLKRDQLATVDRSSLLDVCFVFLLDILLCVSIIYN